MNIYAVLLIVSVFLQGVIGYEIGDMIECGLGGYTTRGQALTDALVILICILFRFALDRILIRNKRNIGLSPMVLDFVSSFFCVVVLAITLEMNAASTFSITLSALVMIVVLSIMYEKDVYLLDGVEEPEEDPYSLDEDLDEDVEEESNDVSETGSETEINRDEEESVKSQKTEVDSIIDKYTSDDKEKSEDSSDDKEVDVEEEGSSSKENEDEEENKYEEQDLRVYVVECVRALAYLASIFVGILALGDIQAEKYGVAYYLILILVGVLAFILRAVTRGLDALIKAPNSKVKFIGFSATVFLFMILISIKSLFAGVVFLLGSYLIKIIIPMLYENYGTGGTKVVKQNIDTTCRLVSRIFALVLILIAIWQLSYGALWETECLMIIAIAMGIQELLIKQNLSVDLSFTNQKTLKDITEEVETEKEVEEMADKEVVEETEEKTIENNEEEMHEEKN